MGFTSTRFYHVRSPSCLGKISELFITTTKSDFGREVAPNVLRLGSFAKPFPDINYNFAIKATLFAMIQSFKSVAIASVVLSCLVGFGLGQTAFDDLVETMENLATDLAQRVEWLHSNRCRGDLASSCYQSNYNECSSAFPNAVCSASETIFVPSCSENVRFDTTVSNLWLSSEVAPFGIPVDEQVREY